MIARNSRTKPQTAGSLVSQAVASLRHWVSASDLHKIKASGIPTLVVSSKYPISFSFLWMIPLLGGIHPTRPSQSFFFSPLLFPLQYTHTSIFRLFFFSFSLVMDWIILFQKIHGTTMRI